jgi:hypothetical protein
MPASANLSNRRQQDECVPESPLAGCSQLIDHLLVADLKRYQGAAVGDAAMWTKGAGA